MMTRFARTCRAIWLGVVHPEVRLKSEFPWPIGKLAVRCLVATGLFVVGMVVPQVLLLWGCDLLVHFGDCPAALVTLNWMVTNDLLVLTLSTIVGCALGYGLELWYIKRTCGKAGITLTASLGLSLDSLGGGWRGVWQAAWRALLVFAADIFLQLTIPPLVSPVWTPVVAKISWFISEAVKRCPWDWLRDWLEMFQQPFDIGAMVSPHMGVIQVAGLFLLVIAAAVCEEVVFRGFLFSALRSSFRKGDWLTFFHGSSALADFAAIFASAFVFAAFHLNMVSFPVLLVLGMLLAELYRRSGSLIPGMMVHCMNNILGLLVLLLIAAH